MLGIFGGTFDPIHIGHLRTLMDTCQALSMSRVHVVPNRVPPHRDQPWLSTEQRYELVEQAVNEVAEFVVDAREISRDGPSYMVDTLRDIKAEFDDWSLCLVIGTDAYNSFTTWHDWQAILQLAHLVVMQRPGYAVPSIPELDGFRVQQSEQLMVEDAGCIWFQDVSLLDVSSTRIRQLLAEGLSIRYLVPECIRPQLEMMNKG